ncbi:MAG: hypothetical protein FJ293_07975 [Planctomycetes bacterium]|nr:hypothetical protein [Planctomycetota bacterium]
MSERRDAPVTVARFVVSTLVVALGAGVLGFAAGRRGPGAAGPSAGADATAEATRARTIDARLAALRAAVAEWAPPDSEAAELPAWVAFEQQVSLDFHRHGFGGSHGAPADPVGLAMLVDLWAETAHRAGRGELRDELLQRARALDPEPQRDAIRAALLASGLAEVRLLAADVSAEALPPPTALLLGLALWRCGETGDALSTWEAAAIAFPADPLLHLLLAWRLPAHDPVGSAPAVRRHLLIARALVPGSARLAALTAEGA